MSMLEKEMEMNNKNIDFGPKIVTKVFKKVKTYTTAIESKYHIQNIEKKTVERTNYFMVNSIDKSRHVVP